MGPYLLPPWPLQSYYRALPDGRLLWGSLARGYAHPADVAKATLLADMREFFPQLADCRVDVVWHGAMAFAPHCMPLIGKTPRGVWYATAFGGHGIVTTAMAGDIVASAIANGGDDTRWELFADAFQPGYCGWPFRRALAQVACWIFNGLDWYHS